MNDTQSETLIIGTWYSKCGNCGESADPHEEGHFTKLGYVGNGDPGCGVIWKYLVSDYMGAGIEDSVQALRPDLEYIDRWGSWQK